MNSMTHVLPSAGWIGLLGLIVGAVTMLIYWWTSPQSRIAALKGEGPKKVDPGDVLVLCCRGPMGSGMEETYQVTAALKYLSWGKHVAVLTDARFSGVSTGACVGHVTPEALAGGPIGKLRDGDRIRIVVDRNKLEGTVDLVGDERCPAGVVAILSDYLSTEVALLSRDGEPASSSFLSSGSTEASGLAGAETSVEDSLPHSLLLVGSWSPGRSTPGPGR